MTVNKRTDNKRGSCLSYEMSSIQIMKISSVFVPISLIYCKCVIRALTAWTTRMH